MCSATADMAVMRDRWTCAKRSTPRVSTHHVQASMATKSFELSDCFSNHAQTAHRMGVACAAACALGTLLMSTTCASSAWKGIPMRACSQRRPACTPCGAVGPFARRLLRKRDTTTVDGLISGCRRLAHQSLHRR